MLDLYIKPLHLSDGRFVNHHVSTPESTKAGQAVDEGDQHAQLKLGVSSQTGLTFPIFDCNTDVLLLI